MDLGDQIWVGHIKDKASYLLSAILVPDQMIYFAFLFLSDTLFMGGKIMNRNTHEEVRTDFPFPVNNNSSLQPESMIPGELGCWGPVPMQQTSVPACPLGQCGVSIHAFADALGRLDQF